MLMRGGGNRENAMTRLLVTAGRPCAFAGTGEKLVQSVASIRTLIRESTSGETTFAHIGDKLFAVRALRANRARRRIGLFATGSPQDDLDNCRRQIGALLGQTIEVATPIYRIRLLQENPGCLGSEQSFTQNVADNAFAGVGELVEGARAFEHQIAHHQQ